MPEEGELPWNRALLASAEKQAALLSECEEEVLRLKITITNLRRRLQQAKLVHANWILRQQAWRAERAELLSRLGPAGKARESERERMRFRFRDDGQ